MFGIGGWELAWLVVLAIVLTPPDKIPELSRKAARVVWFLRNIANNATTQLRQELGPEYANLELSDLNPKTFIQKHLLDDMQENLDEMRAELDDIKADLTLEAQSAGDLARGVHDDVSGAFAGVNGSAGVPFDPEAT